MEPIVFPSWYPANIANILNYKISKRKRLLEFLYYAKSLPEITRVEKKIKSRALSEAQTALDEEGFLYVEGQVIRITSFYERRLKSFIAWVKYAKTSFGDFKALVENMHKLSVDIKISFVQFLNDLHYKYLVHVTRLAKMVQTVYMYEIENFTVESIHKGEYVKIMDKIWSTLPKHLSFKMFIDELSGADFKSEILNIGGDEYRDYDDEKRMLGLKNKVSGELKDMLKVLVGDYKNMEAVADEYWTITTEEGVEPTVKTSIHPDVWLIGEKKYDSPDNIEKRLLSMNIIQKPQESSVHTETSGRNVYISTEDLILDALSN